MTDGWPQAHLGDLYELVRVRSDPSQLPPSTVYLGLEHLESANPNPIGNGRAEEVSSSVTPFQADDVLFGRLRPYLRKVAFPETQGVCTPEILVLRPKVESVEPFFLYVLAASDGVIEECIRMSAGSRMPRTSAKDLASVAILLPPLAEQRRIIDLIATVDTLIEAAKQVGKALNDLAESIAEDLIWSGEHPLCTLKELAVRKGCIGGPFGSSLVGTDYKIEGVPVIRGTNLSAGRFVGGEFVFVSGEKAHDLRRNLAQPGDVIATQRGTIGQVAIVPPEPFTSYVISQSQMRLRVDEERASAEYVYCALATARAKAVLERQTIATANPHINLGIFSDMSIPVPSLDEQRRIADIVLSSRDANLAVGSQLAALQSVRAALLDGLLSGEHAIPDSYDKLLSA
jgi:restriction endonuclease S subunit